MKFLWKIGGEAGFGILTVGANFSKIAARSGYHVFDYIEYPSLIRGGHNAYEAIVSDKEVHGLKDQIDFLVCLDKQTFDVQRSRLAPQAFVIYDPDEFDFDEPFQKIKIPMRKLVKDLDGESVMKNTVALAASLALMKADLKLLLEILEKQFAKKGPEIIAFNEKFAKAGFDHVMQNYGSLIQPYLSRQANVPECAILSGNDAFSLGAVIADCRVYSAYPMTPSSTVLTTLAGWQEKTGIVVRHAEDEISVINTALGASFGGVRAAVGTSGGGFALMVESVSFAGVAEIPIVIFLSQRPGPATGMPTWTEQGDLLFAVHSGHGEFPKIVLAPGDHEEMLELTIKAFDLADIYQTPVIIMSDMFLSESHKSLKVSDIEQMYSKYTPNRGRIVEQPSEEPYIRYKVTPTGISEQLVPGYKGVYYQANSYEHLEDGHTTEEAGPRAAQVEKRNKKAVTYLDDHFEPPKMYGDVESSRIILVCWGSMKGPVLEAINELAAAGHAVSMLHFNHLYPLSKDKLQPFFVSGKTYVMVENNSQAQFARLLRQEAGIDISEHLLKYNGRPFWQEEIIEYVNKISNS